MLHARTGAKLTLEFLNLDNVWNGQPGSVAGELKTVAISRGRARVEDGADREPSRATASSSASRCPGRRCTSRASSRIGCPISTACSSRSAAIRSCGSHRSARRSAAAISRSSRIGNPAAPYRVFVRARAHPWESGSNWVAQGLVQRLLKDDEDAKRFLRVYSVYVLPMANKDGVARGGTRFNLRGKDLNRNWDKPADPGARAGERGAGAVARTRDRRRAAARTSRWSCTTTATAGCTSAARRCRTLDRHLERMAIFEELLRSNTWFTEGATNAAFRNSGTLGDGWLERYGIDAVVHEFNCNWIEGLKDYSVEPALEGLRRQARRGLSRLLRAREALNGRFHAQMPHPQRSVSRGRTMRKRRPGQEIVPGVEP